MIGGLVFAGLSIGADRRAGLAVGAGMLRSALALVGLLNLVFLVGIGVALLQMDPWQFAYGPPPIVIALLVLPLITLGLTLLVVGLTAVGWRSGNWGWAAKTYATLVSMTALGFPVFLNFWNLLGFRY
ncbi:MAG: hypothetical protein R2911_10615 [Caldilineaceae bacterium]